MNHERLKLLLSVLDQFPLWGEFETAGPFGSGHINDTFVSRWNQAGTRVRYLHQRINDCVFVHPDQVMDNISRVTSHIAAALERSGAADRSRRIPTVVRTREGSPYARDVEGGWWRTYLFIEGVTTRHAAASCAETRMLGAAIGRFQKLLADLPEPRLHETIPGFHDMEARYRSLDAVLARDPAGRRPSAGPELAFLEENRERGMLLIRELKAGRIPERICHNDTKMDNILLDEATLEALCVTDLDTVMPGTPLFDLGDLVRTGAVRAAEDERDLRIVSFDLDLFEALLEGYLSEAGAFLTDGETALLAEAGRNITQIMALRFLTDWLDGDRYYRIARTDHNLDRCRNQIALIRSMDAKWEQVSRICGGLVSKGAPTGA